MEKKEKETAKEKEAAAPIMQGFSEKKSVSSSMKKTLLFVAIAVLLGSVTGFALAKSGGGDPNSTIVGKMVNKSSIPVGKTFGVADEKAFKMGEVPEGVLKKGGIEGEGQYHLEREGGAARNVYLTSSNIDLAQFVDRKIKVWGETQKAQTAGWLLDVGKVEVLQ